MSITSDVASLPAQDSRIESGCVPCEVVRNSVGWSFSADIADSESMQYHLRDMASGIRQLAGTGTRYRTAHAASFAGFISSLALYASGFHVEDDIPQTIRSPAKELTQ
jgi:hypothetical protein